MLTQRETLNAHGKDEGVPHYKQVAAGFKKKIDQ